MRRKHPGTDVKPEVAKAFRESLVEFAPLYKRLAEIPKSTPAAKARKKPGKK